MTTHTATPVLHRPTRTLDVGVDLDGVCYDFVSALARWITTTTGRDPRTLPTTASTWEFFRDDWGLTLEEFAAHCNAATDAGYLFRDGAPLDGVVAGIQTLLADGHRVHIVTDRTRNGSPGVAEASTRSWLENSGLRYTSLTMAADKTSVRTDVFIEDRPKNYTALVDAGVDTFLRDQPYNRHVHTPAGRRVHTFAEFVTAVRALAA